MKRIILGAIAALMMGVPVYAETLNEAQSFMVALNLVSTRDYDKAITILEALKGTAQLTEAQAQQVDDLLYTAVWSQAKTYEVYDARQALTYYEKAERLRPEDLQAQSNRGFLLCKLKKYDACNDVFKKVVDATSGEKRIDQISSWAIAHYVAGNQRTAKVIAEEGLKFANQIGVSSGSGYKGLKLVLEGPSAIDRY